MANDTAAAKKKKKGEEEQQGPSKAVLVRYRDRLVALRQAKECSEKDDIVRAVSYYMRYLDSLAAYYGVDEKQLKPTLFDQKMGLAEILMVSQVYWDLAKAYDRNPKMHSESERCLDQFVKFSMGYKFQYINSEIIKKYLRKRMAYNHKVFNIAYEKIRVNSKSCFVATYAFGVDHQITENLREFRDVILKYPKGQNFVRFYYLYSPGVVDFLEENQFFGFVAKIILRPMLYFFSKLVSFFI